MPDIATLGLRVEKVGAQQQVREMTTDLNKLADAGTKAQSSVSKVGKLSNAQLFAAAAIATNNTTDALKKVNTHLGFFSSLEKEAAGHVGEHTFAMNRLELGMASAAEQMTGTNHVVGLLAEGLLKFALGHVETIAVIAGILAVAGAWRLLTEDSRKAREEQDKLTNALKDWYRTEQEGETGERQHQVDAARGSLKRDQDELKKLQDDNTSANAGRNYGEQVANQGAIEALQRDIQLKKDAIEAGEKAIGKAQQDAFVSAQSSRDRELEAIVTSTNATKAERDRARASLQEDLDISKRLMRQYMDSGDPALLQNASDMSQNAKSIQDALAPSKKDIADAASAAKEFSDEMTRILEGAKGLKVQFADRAMAQQVGELAKQLNAVHDKLPGIGDENRRAAAAMKDFSIEAQDLSMHLRSDLLTAVNEFTMTGFRSFEGFFASLATLSKRTVGMIGEDLDKLKQKQVSAMAAGDYGAAISISKQISTLSSYQQMAGYASIGLGGIQDGAQMGQMTQSASGGAILGGISGAAQGAAMGTTLMPGIGTATGAIIGGLAGVVSGFISGTTAAEALSKSMADMKRQFDITIDDIKVSLGEESPLDAALAKTTEQIQQLTAQAKDAYGMFYELKGGMADMKKIGDQLIQQTKDQIALNEKTTQESLQARMLRAEGNTVAADALDLQVEQQKEYAQFVKEGADQATLDYLKQVQAQERLRAAMQATNSAMDNLVQGYHLNLDLFKYSPALGPGDAVDTAIASGPSRPTPVAQGAGPSASANSNMQPIVVQVTLDQKVVATSAVTYLKKISQQEYGTTDKWSDVVGVG